MVCHQLCYHVHKQLFLQFFIELMLDSMQEADEQGRSYLFLRSSATNRPYQIHVAYAARQPSMINLFSIRANVLARYATFIKTGTSLYTLIRKNRSSGFSSLTTWLAHSKKKNCDVCKHPYLFTKGVPSCRYIFRIC